jgi:hypothetical protein
MIRRFVPALRGRDFPLSKPGAVPGFDQGKDSAMTDHLIGMRLAFITVRKAGYTPRVSHDGKRFEIWRDGLSGGVLAGSTMIDWQGTEPFVSRHGLARSLYGA